MAKIIKGLQSETNLEGATVYASANDKKEISMLGLGMREITWLRQNGYETANQSERKKLMDKAKAYFDSRQE